MRELDGSKNFCSLITEDLDDLLSRRDITNDFAGIAADGNKAQVITDSPEYMTDKRKAKIYAIFVKAVISELSGKAVCTAAQVKEWRERYAVKLEGLKGRIVTLKPKKAPEALAPIYNDDAEKIYKALYKYDYIKCNEDVFLWYFGKDNRKGIKQPPKIRWYKEDSYDAKRLFSLFWKQLNKFIDKDKNISWMAIYDYFDLPEKWKKEDKKEDINSYKEAARQAEERQLDREEFDKVINIFKGIEKEKEEEIIKYKIKETRGNELSEGDINELWMKRNEPK